MWKRYRNNVSELIKASEVQFYKNKLKENSENCQSLWKVFGSILSSKKISNTINKIKVNGQEVTEKNPLRKHLTSILVQLVQIWLNILILKI